MKRLKKPRVKLIVYKVSLVLSPGVTPDEMKEHILNSVLMLRVVTPGNRDTVRVTRQHPNRRRP